MLLARGCSCRLCLSVCSPREMCCSLDAPGTFGRQEGPEGASHREGLNRRPGGGDSPAPIPLAPAPPCPPWRPLRGCHGPIGASCNAPRQPGPPALRVWRRARRPSGGWRRGVRARWRRRCAADLVERRGKARPRHADGGVRTVGTRMQSAGSCGVDEGWRLRRDAAPLVPGSASASCLCLWQVSGVESSREPPKQGPVNNGTVSAKAKTERQ